MTVTPGWLPPRLSAAQEEALERLRDHLIANPSRECLVCGKTHWNSLCDECEPAGREALAARKREEPRDA